MNTSKEFVLETLRKAGKLQAETLQVKSAEMTGTELYEEEDFLPAFNLEKQYLNYKSNGVMSRE